MNIFEKRPSEELKEIQDLRTECLEFFNWAAQKLEEIAKNESKNNKHKE